MGPGNVATSQISKTYEALSTHIFWEIKHKDNAKTTQRDIKIKTTKYIKKLKMGDGHFNQIKTFYFQIRESPAPLNIPNPTPAPDRGGWQHHATQSETRSVVSFRSCVRFEAVWTHEAMMFNLARWRPCDGALGALVA